jgi:Kef-type K+ transport system membrane component KefB
MVAGVVQTLPVTTRHARGSQTEDDAAFVKRVRRQSMIVALVVVIVAVVLAVPVLYVLYDGTNQEPEDVMGSLSSSRSAGSIIRGDKLR